MSKIKTVSLAGLEIQVDFDRPFAFVECNNLSDGEILVSTKPNLERGSDDVIIVKAQSTATIGDVGTPQIQTVYLSGLGDVLLVGKGYAQSSFKSAAKGGEQKSISEKMGYASDGLMCHYSADRTHFSSGWRINDLSGNGNAGLFFQLSDRRPVYLTNSGNYINLNQKYIIMPQMDYSQVTLEAVCRFPSTPSAEVDIISNLEAGGYCIFYNANEKKFCGYVRIAGVYEKVLGVDNDLLTHLFTVTYDNRSIKLYVDGQLADETEIAGSIDFPSADTVLAVNVNPRGGNAQENYLGIGSFDFYAARVYSRALSDEEVLQNFSVDRDLFWKN